jgi:hypothetical protein
VAQPKDGLISRKDKAVNSQRNFGTPDRTRTCYPRLRRPVLYPNELRALRCIEPIRSLRGGARQSAKRRSALRASV